MLLTNKEIFLILDLITKEHGFGYSKDPIVRQLQAKLSVMLEVLQKEKEA